MGFRLHRERLRLLQTIKVVLTGAQQDVAQTPNRVPSGDDRKAQATVNVLRSEPPKRRELKMSVAMRQKVEHEIMESVVDSLLTAGFALTVDNGEDETALSTDRKAILDAMCLTDEDRLHVAKDGKFFGWVFFVYGNDGFDVINDYTVNLEQYIGEGTATEKVIQQYE